MGPNAARSTAIVLSALSEGPHTLDVIGADLAQNWQADIDAATISWSIDLSVPSVLLNGVPESITNQTW